MKRNMFSSFSFLFCIERDEKIRFKATNRCNDALIWKQLKTSFRFFFACRLNRSNESLLTS